MGHLRADAADTDNGEPGWADDHELVALNLPGDAATPEPLRPLIGALRRPVPRWQVDAAGRARLDKNASQSDTHGALEPSALRQALQRLLQRAADRAHLADPPLDGAILRRATTHWLRHTFQNNAIDDDVKPAVLRDAMGHADLNTTSIYVRAEQRALVTEMPKMKRRKAGGR